ncbi:MAG: YncE family protein [Candidatus Nitrosotalea sp.]|nr:YncE family protein [Candidatus Nitrosotalea sp.]
MTANKKIFVAIGIAAITTIVFFTYSTQDKEKTETGQNETQNNASLHNKSLDLVQSISLPNVSGRIDHMDIDIAGQRLFVSELGNNSVDIIDLKTGKRVNSISGLHEPQGIIYIPNARKIFVANGGDGTVQVFDSDTFSLVKTISLSSDADNMHYDAYQKLVYVGYGNGGLAIIDPVKNIVIDTIKLGGHPESFQISNKLQPGIFVNVPESNSISVIDAQKRSVVTKWPNSGASGNYPMALDEDDKRLFTVYRSPSQLAVLDTNTGNTIAKLDVVNDADDIWFDGKNKQIYLTGGEGYLDVIAQKDQNNYQEIAKIATGQGGRTSLFVPALDRLYIAIPDYFGQDAKIEVFEIHKIN